MINLLFHTFIRFCKSKYQFGLGNLITFGIKNLRHNVSNILLFWQKDELFYQFPSIIYH